MNILFTNDDGYTALGINTLFEVFAHKHNCYMIAPHCQRSACSNAINIESPIKLHMHDKRHFSLEGYPADCANISFYGNVIPKVDLVISGINHGPNMGDDIYYSGTLAGARTSYVHGLSAIAVSYNSFTDYPYMEDAANFMLNLIEDFNFDRQVFLNVNYPHLSKEKIRGIKYTTLGRRKYVDSYKMDNDEGNVKTFSLSGIVDNIHKDGSDVTEVFNGYISITPLHLDTTDYTYLKILQNNTDKKL